MKASIGIVILIALMTMGVRTYITYALNQSTIEHITEQALHLPTHVDAVWSHWYGFQPRIHLRGVTLLDATTHKPVVRLKQVVIQVDLLKSVLHHQLVPAAVIVRGVRLRLQHGQAQQLMLTGHHAHSKPFDISHLISWMLLQTNISITDVSLTGLHGLPLSNFHLQFYQVRHVYHFYISGHMGSSERSTLTLQGRLKIPLQGWRHANGCLYAAVSDLSTKDIKQLKSQFIALRHLPMHQLSGSAQVWMQLHQGQWQRIISRYALSQLAWGAARFMGLHGKVLLKNQRQHILVNWQQSQGTLTQPVAFNRPLELGQLDTQYLIQKNAQPKQLIVNYLSWKTPDLALVLQGRGEDVTGHPILSMKGSFNIKQLSQLRFLLPLKKLDPSLGHLVEQAFQSGNLSKGRFLYRGPLDLQALSENAAQFEMSAVMHSLTSRFSPVWPPLFTPVMQVSAHNKTLRLVSSHAIDMHTALNSMHIDIPDITQPIMHIMLDASSNARNIMQLLWHSPLLIPLQLKPLNLRGGLLIHLDLSIPLYLRDFLKVDARGAITLSHIKLSNKDWHLDVNDMHGLICFNNKILSSKHLAAQFYGLPLKLKLKSVASTPDPITRLHVNGEFNMKTLATHLKLSAFKMWQGKAPFALRLDLHAIDDPRGDTFYFSSPLTGLSNQQMPRLFSKKAKDKRPIHLVINVHHDQSIFIRGSYNHEVNSALVFHHAVDGFKFYSGNVGLNDGRLVFLPLPGLVVNGHVSQLNVARWLALYQQLSVARATTPSSSPIKIRQVDLHVDQAKWKYETLHHFRIQMVALKGYQQININSREMIGTIDLPDQAASPWVVRVKRLTLPAMQKKATQFKLDYKKIPAMDLKIKHLSVGKHNDGQLSMITRHGAHGLLLKQLHWVTSSADLDLSGAWQHNGSHDKTRLQGHFSSMHWGRCLKRWQASPMLLAGQGTLTFSAWWPGAPTHVDWSQFLGRIALHLKNGTLGHMSHDTMNAVGLGRFLNVFSVGAMMSHMRSDFKDMPDNGLWFNHLDGDWSVRRGVAHTHDLSLAGEVVSLKGRGAVDLAHHKLDMHLAVTPQVTNSLPLVAGVFGGPIVGVAAWVANKMFGQQVDQLSASMVHVTGAWAHPHVKKMHRYRNHRV